MWSYGENRGAVGAVSEETFKDTEALVCQLTERSARLWMCCAMRSTASEAGKPSDFMLQEPIIKQQSGEEPLFHFRESPLLMSTAGK